MLYQNYLYIGNKLHLVVNNIIFQGRSKGWLFLQPEEPLCIIMSTILMFFFSINVFNIDIN